MFPPVHKSIVQIVSSRDSCSSATKHERKSQAPYKPMGAKKSSPRNADICFFVHGARNKLEDIDTDNFMHNYPTIDLSGLPPRDLNNYPQDISAAFTMEVSGPRKRDQGHDDEEDDREYDKECHTGAPNDTLRD